jgi:hypothetical protein
VARLFRYRFVPYAIALSVGLTLSASPARAALEMVIGTQATVAGAPVANCSANAKAALNSVLQNSSSSDDGLQWLAYGPLDSSGHATETAAIHCYAVGDGYVASFACAAQIPPNPRTAVQICAKLVAAFPTQKGGS